MGSNPGYGAYNKVATVTGTNQTTMDAMAYFTDFGITNANPALNQIFPSPSSNPQSALIWFYNSSSGSLWNCNISHAYKTDEPSDFDSLNLEGAELAAEGNIQLPEYELPMNLQTQRYLYQTLKNDSSILGISESIDSFYVSSESSAMKEMYEADVLKSQVFRTAIQERNLLTQKLAEIGAIVSNINYLDSVMNALSDSNVLQQREVLINNLEIKSADAVQLQNTIKQQELIKADEAASKYGEADVSFVIDYNKKVTDTMWLRSVAMGKGIDSAWYRELWTIASQCPAEGGSGVYAARGLLSFISDTIWDDVDRCLDRGYDVRVLWKQPVDSAKTKNIEVFPNPAANQLNISFNWNDDSDYYVSVIDLLGRVRMKIKVHAAIKQQIDVSQLENGVYFVKVGSKEEYINRTTIIINK